MTKPKPPGWGEDSLSNNIEMIHANIHSIFFDQRSIFNLLVRVDGIFEKLRKGLKGLTKEELNVAFFLSMSYGAYLGAAQLALGGQPAPAYMVMRGCLENALYAFKIHVDPGLFEIWKNRHMGETGKSEVLKKFKP